MAVAPREIMSDVGMRVNPETGSSVRATFGLSLGSSLETKRASAILLSGLTAIFLISFLYHPSDGNYFTVCIFRNFTGLPCPGCGLTHSFCALAKGHLLHALEYNVLGPFLFAGAVLLWIRSAALLFGKTGFPEAFDRWSIKLRMGRIIAAAFLLFGAGRIVYLLLFDRGAMHQGPLSKLFGW